MKQKFLMLLAVVLLSCASAFAQNGNNNPSKGDVNEDGKVDVADIAAVINIMKNGGGTTDGKLYHHCLKQLLLIHILLNKHIQIILVKNHISLY